MKKAMSLEKQETPMETNATGNMTEKKSAQNQNKVYIQKIQPQKGAAIVADPGGCRPTGT